MITVGKDVDLEGIERGVVLLLHQMLNDQIVEQAAEWAQRDAEFWSSLGRDDPGITVEQIADENFYTGHVPSLINAPVDRYPNVAVLVPNAQIDPRDNADWSETYIVDVWVEVMCRSLTSEQEANARLIRTMEAVHRTFMSDAGRTLGGTVHRVGATPTYTRGDIFVRREDAAGIGSRWFWQGGRVSYRAEKTVAY